MLKHNNCTFKEVRQDSTHQYISIDCEGYETENTKILSYQYTWLQDYINSY